MSAVEDLKQKCAAIAAETQRLAAKKSQGEGGRPAPADTRTTGPQDWRARAALAAVDTQLRQLQSSEARWVLQGQRTEPPPEPQMSLDTPKPEEGKPSSNYYHATGRLEKSK
jgi:hypothetical protein